MINVKRFQRSMVLKAIKKGIYEDFGQTEIRKLKDKYGYERYGGKAEKKITEDIDFLDNWCMTFDDNSLEHYKMVMGL